MARKKIAFCLCRFLDGGIDTVAVRYLNSIDKNEYDVSLIIGDEYKGLEVFTERLSQDIHVHHLVKDGILTSIAKRKLSRRLKPWEKIAEEVALRPIRRCLQKHRMSQILSDKNAVIDFDSTQTNIIGDAKCKKIAFFHFSINEYCSGKATRIHRLGRKLDHYDHVVTICKAMEKEASELYPHLQGKLQTIYNPISQTEIKALSEAAPHPEEEYFLMVARINESQKDYTTLLRAYAKARDNGFDLPRLKIVGKGPHEHEIKGLAQKLRIEDSLDFLGFMANPMPLIAHCKTFILSTKFEGLATVLIEALQNDRLIVASDCPTGNNEILDGGRCGILTPVGDVDALAKALVNSVRDTSLRARLLSNAAIHKKVFSTEQSLGKLYNLL